MLHRRDVLDGAAVPLLASRCALDRWLRCAVGQPRYLDVQFALDWPEHNGDKAVLAWGGTWHGRTEIGAPLAALQAVVPGLGATVLDTLEFQHVHPVYTPVTAFAQAVEREWGGEDDESWMVDESCNTQEEREALLSQIVTRDMFEECYPAWLLEPLSPQVLRPDTLRALAGEGGRPGAVATAVIAAQAAIDRAEAAMDSIRDLCDDTEGEFVGWATVLRWGPRDNLTRAMRNAAVAASVLTSHRAEFGQVSVQPDRPQDLRRFLAAMRDHCRAARAIDALMATLFDGE